MLILHDLLTLITGICTIVTLSCLALVFFGVCLPPDVDVPFTVSVMVGWTTCMVEWILPTAKEKDAPHDPWL